MKKVTIAVSDMHCASCAQRIEKGIKKLPGVISANVNLATEKATVEFNEKMADEGKISSIIEKLGYKVIKESQSSDEKNKEIRSLKRLFMLSLAMAVPIIIITMPLAWLNIEIPYQNYVLLILATPVQFLVGYRFYKGAYSGLRAKNANMDTLIAIGTSVAYFYSLAVIFFSIGDHVYFESSAMIITFIILGKWLEAVTKGRASEAIKKLAGAAKRF
jgi:Cu+-exporting ATPase